MHHGRIQLPPHALYKPIDKWIITNYKESHQTQDPLLIMNWDWSKPRKLINLNPKLGKLTCLINDLYMEGLGLGKGWFGFERVRVRLKYAGQSPIYMWPIYLMGQISSTHIWYRSTQSDHPPNTFNLGAITCWLVLIGEILQIFSKCHLNYSRENYAHIPLCSKEIGQAGYAGQPCLISWPSTYHVLGSDQVRRVEYGSRQC